MYKKYAYVCDYCGEIKVTEGTTEKPSIGTTCNVCGCNYFHYFVPESAYYPPYSAAIMKLRFGDLTQQWEERKKQKINPNDGKLPTPHCPTCGSENIRHISDLERGANAVAFGFLGNKRKYQFECLNQTCMYKW